MRHVIGDSEQNRAFISAWRLPPDVGLSATLLVSDTTFRLGVAGLLPAPLGAVDGDDFGCIGEADPGGARSSEAAAAALCG